MRSFLHLVFMAWMLVSLSACWHDDDDSSGSGTSDTSDTQDTDVPLNLQGQWAYVHSGEKVWLGARTTLDYTQIDDNLLQHTSQGNTYHLIRAGIQNVQVQGSVKALGSVNPAFKYLPKASADYPLQVNGTSGIAGINVILTNVQDQSTRLETVTDSFGDFSGQIPSGSYEFSATDDTGNTVTAEVTVEDESKDLGEFTLVPDVLYNFKTEIYDDDFLYFGSKDGQYEITYSKTLRIQNIGSQTVSGLSFTIVMDDSDVRSFSYSNILGGMDPGQFIDIPITMSFRRPATDKEISIDVTIRDIQNQTWSDHASLTLSSHIPVQLNIGSTGYGVTGYMVTPGRTLKQVTGGALPYVPDTEFEVVFSNPSIEMESAYSLGFGVSLNWSVFDSFTETGRNEPDNTYATATSLSLYDSMVAYTHVGDVDYFRLKFESSKAPFDLVPVGAVAVPEDAYDMAIEGNYAYVLNMDHAMDTDLHTTELHVVDISNPAQPGIIGTVTIDETNNLYYLVENNVAIEGNYAYVLNVDYTFDTSLHTTELHVVDISNPAQPGIIGTVTIDDAYSYDPGNNVVAIAGNYAYVLNMDFAVDTDLHTTELHVVDISNPAQPGIIGTVTIDDAHSSISGAGNNVVAIAGNHAYVGTTLSSGMYVVDISDPTQPGIVGAVPIDYANDVTIAGNYAYVASLYNGLQVVDISDPAQPSIVGAVATCYGGDGGEIAIVGNYVYDASCGSLHIVDISNIDQQIHISPVGGVSLGSASDLAIVGNYAYILDYDGLTIIQLK